GIRPHIDRPGCTVHFRCRKQIKPDLFRINFEHREFGVTDRGFQRSIRFAKMYSFPDLRPAYHQIHSVFRTFVERICPVLGKDPKTKEKNAERGTKPPYSSQISSFQKGTDHKVHLNNRTGKQLLRTNTTFHKF